MPQIALQIQIEQPVNLNKFARQFAQAYISSLNQNVEDNLGEFADSFRRVHESRTPGDAGRKLGPDYTGAQSRSIEAHFTPLSTNITSLSGHSILQVGYFPQKGRQPVY